MASTSGSFATSGYYGYGYPDHYVFSWTLLEQSIENNTSTISWEVKGSGGDPANQYFTTVKERYVRVDDYSESYDTTYQNTYVGTIAFSGTKVIKHNSDGTRTFSAEAGGAFFYYGSYNTTGSGSWELPTIPRASKVSVSSSSFDVDNGIKINTTKYSSSFYDRLYITVNNTRIKTINNFSSGKVTFTTSELNAIYAAIPAPNTSAKFTFTLSTYSNSSYSTQIGSSSTATATGRLKIVLPTFSDFSYVDNNAATSALTSGNSTSSVIVKGYSNLKVTISTLQKATANTRGATMSHYFVDGGRLPYSSTDSVGYTRYGYTKSSISVVAVDSRGTSSQTITKTLNVIEYTPITKRDDYSYSRSNNGVGSQVTLSFSGKWWNDNFGVVPNTISATYKYKRSTSSSYTNGGSISLTKSGGSYSFNSLVKGDTSDNGFDISESYDIIVTVTDKLSSVDIAYTIHAGEPAIAIYKNKVALGAMYDESLGGTQIWGDCYHNGKSIIDLIYPIGSVYLSVNSTNPKNLFGGTWEQLKDRFLLGAGNTYSSGGTGGSSSHTLTIEEMPKHTHTIYGEMGSMAELAFTTTGNYDWSANRYNMIPNGTTDSATSMKNTETGGGKSYSTMPPYLVVYMWKRTG